jgi:metallophosphoesterase superfamily enzyme
VWIAGNHDPHPPQNLGGEVRDELVLGPLTFRHQPTAGPAPGEIAGHLHPAAKLRGAGGTVRRRCFVTCGMRLVMPALGAYAGGLNVRDAAFAPLFPGRFAALMLGDKVYPVASDKLWPD